MHQFQKCNFWKNSQIPFWGCRGPWGQTTLNPKTTKLLNELVKTRWNPKFGLSDLKNDLLTSMTSEEAQWFFSKRLHFQNQCITLRKMNDSSAFKSSFLKFQFFSCFFGGFGGQRVKKLVFVKVWLESRALANFSQLDTVILKCNFWKKSLSTFGGHWGQKVIFEVAEAKFRISSSFYKFSFRSFVVLGFKIFTESVHRGGVISNSV